MIIDKYSISMHDNISVKLKRLNALMLDFELIEDDYVLDIDDEDEINTLIWFVDYYLNEQGYKFKNNNGIINRHGDKI